MSVLNEEDTIDELTELEDINITAPVNGDILVYDNLSGQWENQPQTVVSYTASNLGTGSEVYKQTIANDFQFRRINAGTNISVSENINDITISNTSTATISTANNLGSGRQVFANVSPSNTLNFRTLTQGAGVSLTENANDINIASSVVGVETNTFNLPSIILNRVSAAANVTGVYTKFGTGSILISGVCQITVVAGTGSAQISFIASFLTNTWAGQTIYLNCHQILTTTDSLAGISKSVRGANGSKEIIITCLTTPNTTVNVNFSCYAFIV